MKNKMKYIEENLFGMYPPSGSAQENYDGFVSEYGVEGLTEDDYTITVEDIQEYFDKLKQEKFKKFGDKHGYLEFGDKELALSQDAYISCDTRYTNHYEAIAFDSDENEYKVYWEITNQDCGDESDACDWSIYTVKQL